MSSIFQRIADAVLQSPRAIAAAMAVVFLTAMVGAVWLQIDLSFSDFFGQNDPKNAAYSEFREHWGADDDLMLIVVDAGGEDLLEPDRVDALHEIGEEIEALASIRTVTSVATAPPLLGDAPGMLDVDPIYDAMPDTMGDEWRAWRARVLGNRLMQPTLVAADGKTAAMLVEARYESSDVNEIRPIVAEVNTILTRWEADSDLHFGLAGIPSVRAAFFDQFMRDQLIFVPLGMVFISACLFFVFRRIHGVLVPGFAALLPVAMVFGIMGWTGEPVGLLSQTFTTLLPAIAVADAIHMVSRFHEALRREAGPGVDPTEAQRRAAVREAATRIGGACLLTSVTTGIGFLSLLLADMPILQGFGLYAALGIFLAYGGVLFLVPLLLLQTRRGVPPAGDPNNPTPGDRFLLACADVSIRRPVAVLVVTAGVVATSLWFGRQVIVDNNLTQALQDDHPVTQANVRADQELGGIIGLEIDLRGDEDSLKDPEVLAALLEFEAWALEEEPTVRQANSPATWAAMLHEATTGEYKAPDSREAAAQFYLLAEGDPAFLRMVDGDYARGRMLLTIQDEGGLDLIATTDRLDAGLQERVGGTAVTANMTGTPYVAYRGINNVTFDLRESLGFAFVVIAIIITLLFRDLRTGLLCLVPNALPLVVGYGLMGLMGWMLDPTPAVIFTVALGIAVDDTLHMVIRTREELEKGQSMPQAVRTSVLHSGRAVGITSVILAFGFGINALSAFKATSILGMLGATVILTAFLCDLFVLPALLVLWGRKPG